MKLSLLVAGLLLSMNLWALVPDPFLSISCRNEIEQVIKKHASKDKWTRTVDPQQGVLSFRSPTKEIGKWVEIQSFPNPYVFFFEKRFTKVYQWDGKTCSVLNDTTNKPLSFLTSKKAGFTDAKLKKYVESDKPAMIYVWSPSMVYSMSEMKVFRQVAKDLDLEFVPVLDFNENPAVAKKLIAKYEPDMEMHKFQSLELYMREGTIHFPSTYIAGLNRISNRIFGVFPADLLKEEVLDELAFIKRVDK